MKVTAQLKKFSTNRGFTLIELLVVIAIIGILAAALIATIDPLEQIKKSQDTTTKNTAVEYLNALTRYYATHQEWPWDVSTTCTTAPNATTIAAMGDCTAQLLSDNELKSGFVNAQGLDKIFVTFSGGSTNSTIAVCFEPISKSQQNDPNSKFDNTGNGTSGTFWCTK